ncbi:hypothetical protein COEREDRAFT_37667 [Coemansia reversa NRRL 1564]|uniref:N-acetyltransferase domain-containing protein n=1 Tax=Coemansia reversa (strain ATCC 12441 / NRRL 1564) TaxID=763665 RepID=A0A2G5BJF0_COERN|nr:hypothetical protein COEREDRAFT_37667 [Coemansia reversa NRRL 1564]|eukprot:PIA19129.1 hypothetical protein COEREDRAFT_37667 [Coemansia reversa NRRL 1564]
MVMLVPPDEDQDMAFSCLFSDPETMKFLKSMMPIKQSSIPKSLLGMINDREFLPPRQIPIDNGHIDIDEPYLIIGCCGLDNIDLDNRCSDASVILDARFWHSGASTEAMYLTLKFGFETLCLHRVGIQTAEDNVDMHGWMENVFGVQVECIKKEALYLGHDEYMDSWEYAIFDHEWYITIKKELRKRRRIKH